MNYIEEIKKLKREKNAVVLAHCYQNVEIDEVADYVGDSLYLSQMAEKTNADIIIFSGLIIPPIKLALRWKKYNISYCRYVILFSGKFTEYSGKEFSYG